jgi:hypothetical protein
MKNISLALVMAGLLLSVACQRPTDDPEKLKTVLINYFEGIKTKDHQKMIAATTDDFLVYEEGKVWTNDSVFKEMDRQSYTVDFRFDNFRINVDQSTGHMSYFEQANFVFRDTVKANLRFLGSAAFRKTSDGWKMIFMHATPRHKPKKKVTQ